MRRWKKDGELKGLARIDAGPRGYKYIDSEYPGNWIASVNVTSNGKWYFVITSGEGRTHYNSYTESLFFPDVPTAKKACMVKLKGMLIPRIDV